MADHHVHPLLDPIGDPRLPPFRGHRVGLHHRHPEAVPGEDVVHPLGDVPGSGVGGVDQHPPPLHPLRRHQFQQGFPLGVYLLLRQGRHLHDDVAAPGVEHRLPPGAAVGVGQEGLQVGGKQPLGALGQCVGQGLAQLVEDVVVGPVLGVPDGVRLGVHGAEELLLLVGGQAGGHVGEPEEHGVAYQVEQRRGREARPLPHHLAVLAASAVPAVLHRVVVGLADGVLLEAVALYPAVLVGAPELRPDGGREPVEQVEQRARIASGQSAGQAEGLAAGVGEDARRDALGRTSPLIFMNLVAYKQVEEAPHPVLHVVGQRVSSRPGGVGLPQRRAAVGAGALPAGQVLVR